MTNDKKLVEYMNRAVELIEKDEGKGRPIGFAPICPICGASDHKRYLYKGTEIIACPKIRRDAIYRHDPIALREAGRLVIRNMADLTELNKEQVIEGDKYYCGLEPWETGEQDPYWRDGVCQQHDKRFIEGKKSTWVVTRDFVTGATKTMLRGAWAVAGYPWYLLIGGLGGAVKYALKRGKK